MRIFLVLFFTLLCGQLCASSSCFDLLNLMVDKNRPRLVAFDHWLKTQDYTLLTGAPSESRAFVRQGVALEGNFRPRIGTRMDSEHVLLTPSGKMRVFDGQEYIEFPNSTALQTIDPVTKEERVFILTRGVRSYTTMVDITNGTMSPQKYVSDVLLFEQQGDDYVFIHTVLKSDPENNFRFEDPRISFVLDQQGRKQFFLSGTDYSPHTGDLNDPDVMNRYLELSLDERGVPRSIKLTSQNKEQFFKNLGPAPTKYGDDYVFVDTKNATIYQNEYEEIVVRARMRPDFNSTLTQQLAGQESWKYGEQVFVFKNMEEFEQYDWQYALTDLFKGDDVGTSRVRPQVAEVLLKDEQLNELYLSDKLLVEHGKGFGPGCIPVRVRRQGQELFLSDNKGAIEYKIGQLKGQRVDFPLQDGEVKYLSFDHEIRFFTDTQQESDFVKRHYTATVKLFNDRLTAIEAYYADVIQPLTKHERGLNSGIVDLQHVYPMGRVIVDDSNTGKKVVRVFAGASDAHTTIYDFDIMQLLEEMSLNSPRRASGQVYIP